MLVVAYALSPIDLIPDVIPVLGLLDDVILLPIGIMLVRRMILEQVLEDARAHPVTRGVRLGMIGAAIIVVLWIAAAVGLIVAWRAVT